MPTAAALEETQREVEEESMSVWAGTPARMPLGRETTVNVQKATTMMPTRKAARGARTTATTKTSAVAVRGTPQPKTTAILVKNNRDGKLVVQQLDDAVLNSADLEWFGRGGSWGNTNNTGQEQVIADGDNNENPEEQAAIARVVHGYQGRDEDPLVWMFADGSLAFAGYMVYARVTCGSL
jgi:hypothetical protein